MAAADRLAGWTPRWPLAEAAIEPTMVAYAEFLRFRGDGRLAANAWAQISVELGTGWPDGTRSLLKLPAIPLADMAVQVVFPLWDLVTRERAGASADGLRERALTALCSVVEPIPAAVDVAVHFCCRDGARYGMAADDMRAMVDLSNRLVDLAGRPIALLHLPVPLRHPDDGFFRGLAELGDAARQILCLGLVHLSDGVEGALQRAGLASRFARSFAIGARCGFAARSDEDIPRFLDLHAEVAARLGQGE